MARIFLFLLFPLFWSCGSPPHQLPAFADPGDDDESRGVRVIVETPAGSTHLGQYDPVSQMVLADSAAMPFLPVPGNLGYVPSTRMPYQGEGFAPVRVLVLGERLEAGDMISVHPFAAVILQEQGSRRVLVLGVPVKESLRTLDLRDVNDLLIRFPGVKDSLEAWLRQHKGGAPATILDWKDGSYAIRFIRASLPKMEEFQNN